MAAGIQRIEGLPGEARRYRDLVRKRIVILPPEPYGEVWPGAALDWRRPAVSDQTG